MFLFNALIMNNNNCYYKNVPKYCRSEKLLPCLHMEVVCMPGVLVVVDEGCKHHRKTLQTRDRILHKTYSHLLLTR